MSARVPHVGGVALISGRAAYVLAAVLDPDELRDRAERRGLHRGIDDAIAALEAIDIEAARYREEVEARKASASGRRKSGGAGTERCASGRPLDAAPSAVPESGAMDSTATLSVQDAAALTGDSPSWVRRLASRGVLRARRVGRDWQLDAADVRARATSMKGS